MTPDEERGRRLTRRALVGLVWFLIELAVLAMALRLAGQGDIGAAYGVGIFLILLSYCEGRFRRR